MLILGTVWRFSEAGQVCSGDFLDSQGAWGTSAIERCDGELGCVANNVPVALMLYSGRFLEVCLAVQWVAVGISLCMILGLVGLFCQQSYKAK